MIKVAICDDDIQFIYKLEQSIFRFAEMKRIKVDVDGYTSGAEFIQKLQQSERYDLLFLDIELGDSSGIIVGNWIRSQIQYESMQIVFVSAKEMYAMQLFDLRPMNFLVKPIQQERVDYILDEYERLYQFQPHIIEIGKGRNAIRIEEHSVFYLQSLARKIQVVTANDTLCVYCSAPCVYKICSDRLGIHKYIRTSVSLSCDQVYLCTGCIGKCVSHSRKCLCKFLLRAHAVFQSIHICNGKYRD